MMHHIYFSLGTNIGDRQSQIRKAVGLMERRIGPIVALSSFLETEPWGFESQNTFLNAASHHLTELSPLEVLMVTEDIEKLLGRKTKSQDHIYHDRPIDIDILLYDNLVLDSQRLTIPHGLMHKRRFVLEPLCEISPKLVHPVLKKRMDALLLDL